MGEDDGKKTSASSKSFGNGRSSDDTKAQKDPNEV